MNSAGIDVSKGKSMVAVFRPFNETVAKPFEVRHTGSELKHLADYLKSLNGETRVVMEHTGRYYEQIAQYLHDAGIYVSAVNPKLIKDYGAGNTLRHVKTDKADAKKIAKYDLDRWAELREYTPMDTIRYQLKTLNRQCGLYTKTKTMMKNNLIALLDQTYPGVNALFNSPVREDGTQKWVDFAASFWHVDCVRGMGQSAFVQRYTKWCKQHEYHARVGAAEAIYEGAKDLIAMLPKDDMTKLLVRQAVASLNAVSATLERLKTEMLQLASQLPEFPVVMAMRGVGGSLGPQLMAEIGDVTRFAHRGSIISFAGVDPGANQSGTHEAKSVRTSKSGPPELRRALFLVMECLLKTMPQDDPVYQFMDKKRSEGKPYLVYMTAGTNKFLRIYFGKVKEYLAKLEEPSATNSSQRTKFTLTYLSRPALRRWPAFCVLFYPPHFYSLFCKFPLDFIFADFINSFSRL